MPPIHRLAPVSQSRHGLEDTNDVVIQDGGRYRSLIRDVIVRLALVDFHLLFNKYFIPGICTIDLNSIFHYCWREAAHRTGTSLINPYLCCYTVNACLSPWLRRVALILQTISRQVLDMPI